VFHLVEIAAKVQTGTYASPPLGKWLIDVLGNKATSAAKLVEWNLQRVTL